jgi:hypothetical protein
MKLPFEGGDLDREVVRNTGVTPWGDVMVGGKPHFQAPMRSSLGVAVPLVVAVIILLLAAAVIGFAMREHFKHPRVELSEGEMCVNGWNGYRSCISRHDDDYVSASRCALDGVCSSDTASR